MTGRCRRSWLFRLGLSVLVAFALPLLHRAIIQVGSPSQVLLERRSALQAKKVAELKGLLRRKGLKVSGCKDDLVKRLLETVPEANKAEPLELWRLSRVQLVRDLGDPKASGAVQREAKQRWKEFQKHFSEIHAELRDQQKHSIQQGLLRRGRCLIGDEMGLGKTLTSLVLAEMYAEEWPVLVVAPTVVVDNWINEVKKWLPHMENQVEKLDSGFLTKKHLIRSWEEKMIFVTSYDQLWRHPQLGQQADGSPYKVVILDEAHKIKDPKSQRTKAMLPICAAAQRCILLSGTPVLNCAAETWPLMAALDLQMPSYDAFCERYCDFKETEEPDGSITRRPVGARHGEELNQIFSSYMVRHKKEEVLTDLAQITKYRQNFREKINGKYVQKIVAIMKSRSQGNHNALVAKVFSQTAQAKAAPVVDFVEARLANQTSTGKLVVFGHHHVILNQLEEMLKRTKRPYIRVDGRVHKNMRQGRIDRFQEDPEVEVAIVAMKACGHGVSLTAADTVIFAELYWVPAILLQAEARVHRPGLQHSAKIIYCVLEGSPFMDDAVIKKIIDKERLADLLTDGETPERSRFESLAGGD